MRRSAGEVFLVFLRLGVTSFGGPIAHLGYFRDELVARRRWVSDAEYADLVALCQFLPGPASSQVGFALGLARAGILGAVAAFLAFTLPSAVLMFAIASATTLLDGPVAVGAIGGLKIVAVAVVAQAVWGMARTLTPDARRAGIAVVAATCALLVAGAGGQLVAIGLGAVAGLWLCRDAAADKTVPVLRVSVPRWAGWTSLAVFVTLLIALPVATAATGSGALSLADAFFRAGSLVFGGGHVVLPLLDAGLVQTGWVSESQFLTGYGAAQAMPGPLFSVAAYYGAVADIGPGGAAGAALALVALFLPGFLLLVGVLPFWTALRTRPWAGPLVRGANAAVVGILAAALYTPVFTSAVTDATSFALALICFVLLVSFRVPSWLVVIVGAVAGVGLELLPL